jgi:hypothetical protein
MRITLHCLNCGFLLSLNLPARDTAEVVNGSLACGQCGCRRWAAM